tara:strand:- start:583 stop:762 length:180 start_codon:yes stop_codon:yes gene_type:complete
MGLVNYKIADFQKIGLLRRHRLNDLRLSKSLALEEPLFKRIISTKPLVLYFGVYLLYPI